MSDSASPNSGFEGGTSTFFRGSSSSYFLSEKNMGSYFFKAAGLKKLWVFLSRYFEISGIVGKGLGLSLFLPSSATFFKSSGCLETSPFSIRIPSVSASSGLLSNSIFDSALKGNGLVLRTTMSLSTISGVSVTSGIEGNDDDCLSADSKGFLHLNLSTSSSSACESTATSGIFGKGELTRSTASLRRLVVSSPRLDLGDTLEGEAERLVLGALGVSRMISGFKVTSGMPGKGDGGLLATSSGGLQMLAKA